MTVAGYCHALKSFRQDDIYTMCKRSLVYLLPLVPALRAIRQIARLVHPQFGYSLTVGKDFLITDCKDQIALPVQSYIDSKVSILVPNVKKKQEELSKWKKFVADVFYDRVLRIGRIAVYCRLQKVSYALSISESASPKRPFKSFGCRFSILSNPILVARPPEVEMTIEESKNVRSQGIENERAVDFMTGVEVIHISKNHDLIAAIGTLAYAVLATNIWKSQLQKGLSFTAFGKAVVIGYLAALSYQIVYHALRRYQNKRADMQTVHTICSYEDAQMALDLLEKRRYKVGLGEYPLEERKKYIKELNEILYRNLHIPH